MSKYPIIQQLSDYDCGVAVTQSVLLYLGLYMGYKDLEKELRTTYNGTSPDNICMVLDRFNIIHSKGNTTIEELKNNKLSIILIQSLGNNYNNNDNGHYVSVIGHTSRSIIIADPSTGKEVKINNKLFMNLWHDEGYNNFAIIIK